MGFKTNRPTIGDRMLLIRRAADTLIGAAVYVKFLIYADSGIGKTWLVAKTKRPLILLTEKNGYASAAHSNPDAMIMEVNTTNDLRKIVLDIKQNGGKRVTGQDETGKEIKVEFETLVIDSLTEIQRLFKQDIIEDNGRDAFSQQDWGKLADQMRKFIRMIRDLNCHVVCTCLLDSYIEEASGQRYLKPMFEGRKTKAEIMQFFSACGYLAKKSTDVDGTKTWERHLVLDAPSYIVSKPCHPVGGVIENPDLEEIIDLISGYKKEVEDSNTFKNQNQMKATKSKTNGRRRAKKGEDNG